MLTTRLVGRTPVLRISGTIAGDRDTDALAAALHRFDRIGIDNVVVDLTNVPRVDVRGLGVLVAAGRRFQNRGCRVTLVGVTARLRDLMTITLLVTAFETYETVDAFVVHESARRPSAAVGRQVVDSSASAPVHSASVGATAISSPAQAILC